MSDEKLLSLEEVMFITKLGRSSVFAYAKNGRLPPLIKIHARKVAWTESSIQQWIRELQNTPPTPKALATNIPQSFRLSNCSLTARVFDGVAELVLENGTDEPCFIRGVQEIQCLLSAGTNLLNSTQESQNSKIKGVEAAKQNTRMLRLPEVMHRVGLKKSSIYDGIQKGTFPNPIKLSRRAVCWPESQITDWLEKLAAPAGIEPASTP